MIMDKISLALVIIGALNWGGIGLFRFDTVAWICGGQGSIVARIIYTLVALAGIWCISLLFREEDPAPERGHGTTAGTRPRPQGRRHRRRGGLRPPIAVLHRGRLALRAPSLPLC